MSHVEQLERETEQSRAQFANTLDELRACITPGHVLDQLADRVSGGAVAAFGRNLKDQTVNNPLPVTLIGAGLAWLALTPRGNARGDGTSGTASRLGDAAGDTAEKVGNAADATTDAIRENAGAMADSMQQTAAAGYDAIAGGAHRTASALSESARAARERTLQTSDALLTFCREQPLVVAGLGLVVGAMMGALLPSTEAEDQLMGDTSDRVKEQAKDLAADQYETAKQAGERALDATRAEGETQSEKQARNVAPEDSMPNEESVGAAPPAPSVPMGRGET